MKGTSVIASAADSDGGGCTDEAHGMQATATTTKMSEARCDVEPVSASDVVVDVCPIARFVAAELHRATLTTAV
jgi:hypothetical protein